MEQLQRAYISSNSQKRYVRSRSEWNPTLILLIMALLTLLTVFAARELITGTPGF